MASAGFLPIDSAPTVRANASTVAVLPIGSYEQHGSHLPCATDTIVASLVAGDICEAFNLLLLPAITFGSSHEHAALGATVSIRASTMIAVINDIADSVRRLGIKNLVLVNGHGGNYVLSNIVQEATVDGPQMALFPGRGDWDAAREAAGMETSTHDDMHAGELETSILMHADPTLVGPEYSLADHDATDRPLLLTLGIRRYAEAGVIGRPSLATAAKGRMAVATLRERFVPVLDALG